MTKEIINNIELYNADCFDVMPLIEDKSIDCIIADLPYGTTACKWDSILPFDKLWEQYKRIIKDNGAIVLFGSEPFSSYLRLSNIKMYKYDWIWYKKTSANVALAKYQPLKTHEIISVFNNNYYPQMKKGKMRLKGGKAYTGEANGRLKPLYYKNDLYYPKSVLDIKTERGLHPTQKPVALLEYLIKTYSNENELILDNTMGSGTTGVACQNTNRKFIGIEKETNYFDIAVNRIKQNQNIFTSL